MGNTVDHSEETVIDALIKTYEDLASRVEHIMLAPDMTEDQVTDGCRMAYEYGIASCCVRPSDVDAALRILGGSPVRLGSVAGSSPGGARCHRSLLKELIEARMAACGLATARPTALTTDE